MKSTFAKHNNLDENLLHDEILRRYPEWRGTLTPEGWYEDPLVKVTSTQDIIEIEHPDADLRPVAEATRGKAKARDRWRQMLENGYDLKTAVDAILKHLAGES